MFARYAYPEWLVRHSLAVGEIAAVLARAARDAGLGVDVEAVSLAGYLHDIGKSPLLAGEPRDHNELSALVLHAEGLPALAEPARRHPAYAVSDPRLMPMTLAERIVFYADRRVLMTVVSLEERMAEQSRRAHEYDSLRPEQLRRTLEIERELFAALPFGPDALAGLVA